MRFHIPQYCIKLVVFVKDDMGMPEHAKFKISGLKVGNVIKFSCVHGGRMKHISSAILLSGFLAAVMLSSCSPDLKSVINIVDAKIATGVDEKLLPVKVTDTFPIGTSTVSCWMEWKDARLNTQLVVKWHYVTDDVHIYDYSLTIPKKDGSGSVDLKMADGKSLPAGSYRVDICLGRRVLKSLTFTIQ